MSEENTNSLFEENARQIIEAAEEPAVKSLGKAQKFVPQEASSLAGEIGWKNVPLENLPSQGLFYPDGTEITIRSASVAEIRHWSTIDENDALGIDDMLNFVIERCCRIRMSGRPSNFKDLKEIDRFYLLFAIRDYTFKNGENRLYTTYQSEDGGEERIEITKDAINYFKPDETLMRFYNSELKRFVFEMKNGEIFDLHFPSLGVMSFIKNYAKLKTQRGQKFDRAFLRYAPFLLGEWKGLNDLEYDKSLQDSLGWSIQKISLMDKITTMLANSVNPEVVFLNDRGEEATVPLSFRGGIKSVFLIPDILDELV